MERIQKMVRLHLHAFAVWLIIGVQALLLAYCFEPAYSTPDANGYFKQGQLIATHGRTWCRSESPVQYMGIHWTAAQGDRIYCRYPPGQPLLIAILYQLFGPQAGIAVNCFFTTLTLLGLYLLCRAWIGKGWALVAMAVMACNPIALSDALIGDSHAAAALFLVWGLVFLIRWSQHLFLSSAFIAGFLLGAIPSIRYPEALFGLGIAYFIFFRVKNDQRAIPGAVAALIGAAIPITCLMVYNLTAFGAVWKTSYDLTMEQTGFGLVFFSQNIGIYMKNLWAHGLGLVWVIGLAGLGVLSINRSTRQQGLLLTFLVLPMTLLYISYFFMLNDHPNSTLRFLLPTYYLYTVAAVWCLKLLHHRWRRTAAVATIVLMVFNTVWAVPQVVISMVILRDADASLAAVGRVVHKHVKPGAVVIAPFQIQQHLDYLGHWKLLDSSTIEGLPAWLSYMIHSRFASVAENPTGKRPPQLALNGSKQDRMLMIISPLLKRKALMRPYTAATDGELPAALLDELLRWSGSDGEFYWIGNLDDMKERVAPADRLTVVERIEPPRLMMSSLKARFPNQADQMEGLTRRLWKGLLLLDQFIVNPLGITGLVQKNGGLELVKWTRYVDP